MPYIEGNNQFNAYNFVGDDRIDQGIQAGMFRYGGAANTTVTYGRFNAYLCPSDPNNNNLPGGGGWPITCHNYVVNFGNTITNQPPLFAWNNTKLPFLGAPFTDIGAPDADITAGGQQGATASTVKFSAITDGLSNTLMTSEILIGQGWNLHGFSWWGYAPRFTGLYPPNSSQPDVMQGASYCNSPNSNPQGVTCVGANGSQSSGGLYTGLGMVNIPRSRHPGGVNTGMCDGSVRFIKNSVSQPTYWALGTRANAEVVDSSSY
jgi:prepilin-type processing-associated H-X9-DG protein